MTAVPAANPSDARLRDVSMLLLVAVYLAPLVYTVPPSVNVVVTATLVVFAACLRTLGGTHEAEILSQKEALRFPIIGSVSLLCLFLAVKFLPRHWLNYVITAYFCIIGIFAIGELVFSLFQKRFPPVLVNNKVLDIKGLKIPLLMPEPEDISMTLARAICNAVGLGFTIWYATQKHFMANNGLGLAYSLEGIAMLNLSSTQVGIILLGGLFVYDIFWVFFTPVMVTVAKGIDGPIKLLFPTAVAGKFNMLGLGDIVIPGIFLALMLRFDARNRSGKAYFFSAMIGYTAGLVVTILVMNVFKAAQPALLYIVPAVLSAVFLQALHRGEVKQLWSYTEEEEEEAATDQEPSPETQAPVTVKKVQ